MNVDLPYSEACARNREPILAVLRRHFADRRHVFEVGSGTGQHAVHFATAMPWLQWQCADRPDWLPGLRAQRDAAVLPNLPPPLSLTIDAAAGWQWRDAASTGSTSSDADADAVPASPAGPRRFDALFSANTLHIMAWPQVVAFFAGLDAVLADDAVLVVYGPFNDGGRFSSHSNRDFDASLRARDPAMGLRDVEAVDALAARAGLVRVEMVALPANNRCMAWSRGGTG